MKKVYEYIQKQIDVCEDMDDIYDIILNEGLDWYEYYTFKFKDELYKFTLVNSGRGDDPGSNYPEIGELENIKNPSDASDSSTLSDLNQQVRL